MAKSRFDSVASALHGTHIEKSMTKHEACKTSAWTQGEEKEENR